MARSVHMSPAVGAHVNSGNIGLRAIFHPFNPLNRYLWIPRPGDQIRRNWDRNIISPHILLLIHVSRFTHHVLRYRFITNSFTATFSTTSQFKVTPRPEPSGTSMVLSGLRRKRSLVMSSA